MGAVMAGASAQTKRVTVLNGNWEAGEDGQPGTFALLVVTEDGERHTVATTPESVIALMAMARPGTVLLWDPVPRALIVANIVGDWLPQDWSATRSGSHRSNRGRRAAPDDMEEHPA